MVGAGWSLVWRRQRLLWWLYVLSLVFGWFASRPLVVTIGPILDNSLAAGRLYHSFDLATYGGLMMLPEVNLQTAGTAASALGVVFLVLMLLMTGGILKVYNEDRTFATAEFFGAGGQFFWRFVRLLLFLVLVLIPVVLIAVGFNAWSNHLSDRIAQPGPGVAVSAAGTIIVLLLAMMVRLWFDMAEVHAVAENEYASRRAVASAFGLMRRNFGSLFWMYFRLSFLAAAGMVLGLWILIRFVPHEGIVRSFLLTQAIIFWWILTRLWQRASETLWYQEHAPAPEPAVIPAPFSPPEPVLEFPEAGPGSPPADVPL